MYNIAVTGVGGGVGQSILKSLQGTEYNVVALDGEPLGAGLFSAKSAYLIPYANSHNYIDRLLEICKRENISLLFPGLDAELMPLSLHRDAFKAIGTTVVVSRPEVINISDDKQETYDKLTDAGITVPFTTSPVGYDPVPSEFPLILKQKVGGARSKNVYVVKNLAEWKLIIEKIGQHISDFIVMEYIEGEEYTCGTVNLGESCRGVIVMKRILRDGDTHKCFTENNEIVENEVRRAVEAIKPFGACNVQLRLKGNKPYIFEINARCSGTTAARTLSGFNEPKMIADYLLKGLEPEYRIIEQTILRYWKEIVVETQNVLTLKNNLELHQKNNPLL